jgi:hypothetical protein
MVMKKILFVLAAILLATTAQAKKVKVTIDGTVSPSQTKLYLIINEDTANAQLLPIKDAKFSVTVKVDRDAFIRLHDYKQWPERSVFVLIPDRKHITIDWNTGSITGSQQSSELQAICKQIRDASPNGFHIDVFSDDPEAWRQARIREASIREDMMNQQKKIAKEVMLKNKDKIYGAWIMYTFPELLEGELNAIINYEKPKWAAHPILKAK